MKDTPPTERFAAAWHALEEELDWARLGECYCHAGGEAFFPPEQVEALRDAGLLFAADLGELPTGGPSAAATSQSLYVGAAVAELLPALFEACVLGRTVTLVNLDTPETREINRALGLLPDVLAALGPIRVEGWSLPRASCDHVWMASVLTDPEAFPALHAELYGRPPKPSKAALRVERERARSLVHRAAEVLRPPGRWTTSDEERVFLEEECDARGWRLGVPEAARLSAIVGDPLRTYLVS